MTGWVVPMPRYSEDLIVDQYVASQVGPIYQAAGDSKWLHQVTTDFTPVANHPIMIVQPFFFFGSGFIGCLATNRLDDGALIGYSGALAIGMTLACQVACGLLCIPISIALWG